MRWKRGHRSANVEDRRRTGGVRGLPGSGRSQMGCGGILLLLVLSVVFKQDFFSLLDATGGGVATSPSASVQDMQTGGVDPDQELKEFVSFVLDDAQAIWHQTLPRIGSQYRDAKLVLCSLSEQIREVFEISGFDKVLAIHPTRAAALAALKG